ncbi:N-alpha-acetyltransferase 38, NatC auxiliary subunit [Trichogramma pretiosum]|uniref:N-alpha-acetyltransferase 38, NatC auxiliary subunit n=1 Tax=Trichogramma pretiosum TaxID=7493 RepID=UPI0006C980E9|nr:N-alpha-acetyltransferase 38, NatC auxiliary subunit [Trichogramma pretiosum]
MDPSEKDQHTDHHIITNDEKINENGEVNEAINLKDSPGRQKLRSWLNRRLWIKMTDGRILIGSFLCTDRDANIILGLCAEYLSDNLDLEARTLGLVMVPGRHIVSIHLDV